jgi:hypothetical protein
MSCAISESDAESLLCIERKMTEFHGMQFAISRVEARLRAATGLLFPATHEEREHADAKDGNQSSDRESGDIGIDSDSEGP